MIRLRLQVSVCFWVALLTLPVLAANPISPQSLKTHVRYLSEQCVPRDATHPENLDKAAAYIKQQFTNAGGRVTEQTYTVDGKTYRNVIVQFGPVEGERIVIGAHYDAVLKTPGADDNASGVAGLIEMAYMFSYMPPRTCVELVAFTLEEAPFFRTELMGSAIHAAELEKSGVKVRYMLSLDMIGYFSGPRGAPRPHKSLLSWFDPGHGDYIVVVGRIQEAKLADKVRSILSKTSRLPVVSLTAKPGLPHIDRSDHFSYWKHGYPALVIADASQLRGPHYHAKTDTADTLDYERMARVVQGIHAVVNDDGDVL